MIENGRIQLKTVKFNQKCQNQSKIQLCLTIFDMFLIKFDGISDIMIIIFDLLIKKWTKSIDSDWFYSKLVQILIVIMIVVQLLFVKNRNHDWSKFIVCKNYPKECDMEELTQVIYFFVKMFVFINLCITYLLRLLFVKPN